MLRSTAVACAIAALAAGVLGVATASAKRSSDAGACPGAYVVAYNAPTLAKASDAVLCLVNKERAARGLGAMRASSPLESAASSHSADMVAGKYFSHVGRAGDGVAQRVSRVGYPWTAVGETLAWGAARRAMPLRLVASFMRSKEHRSILLSRSFRDLGVGLALGAPMRGGGARASTLTLVFANR